MTNEIEGLEALVRWQNPKRGMLAPDAFLSLASDIGVLAKIDDIVLQRTIADFQHWHQMGLNVPRFSVNISLGRLMEDDLLERLDAMNLPRGTVAPLAMTMSSKRMPLSGILMPSAYCMAFEVNPIFQPTTLRPSASFARQMEF